MIDLKNGIWISISITNQIQYRDENQIEKNSANEFPHLFSMKMLVQLIDLFNLAK